jgi:hypothetical protein
MGPLWNFVSSVVKTLHAAEDELTTEDTEFHRENNHRANACLTLATS